MTKTCYTYSGLIGLYFRAWRILVWVLPIFFSFAIPLAVFNSIASFISGTVPAPSASEMLVLLCLGVLYFCLPWVVAVIVTETMGDICVDDAGLSVSYLFGWRRVAWKDVVAVLERRIFFMQSAFVVVRHPAPRHYFYGLVYALYTLKGFQPGVLIPDELEKRQELIATIRERVQARGV